MANSKYDRLNKRLSYAFSNVGKDISRLRRDSNEKFINREDYIKLFTAHTKLKKDHNKLIDDLKNNMENRLSEINNRIKIQNKENNKINNHLAKLVEKERANRAEIKEVDKLKNELEKLKKGLDEFKTEYLKKIEYNKLNVKVDKKIEEIDKKTEQFNKKIEFLMKHSVDVEDVENNFITSKKVNKEFDKIKKEFKKNSEKEHSNYETKTNHLKQEVDDINTTLKKINDSVNKKIDTNEFNKTRSILVEQSVLDKEMKKLKDSVDSVNTDLKKFNSKKEVTHEELAKIQDDINKIKNNIILKKEVEKILESNTIKYQKIKEDMDWVEDKIKKIDKDLSKNKDIDFSRFADSKEIMLLKSQIEKTGNNLSKAMIKEKEIERLGKQLDNIKKDIGDKVTVKDMDRTISQLSSKLESLKNEVSKIERKNVSIKKVSAKITKKINKGKKAKAGKK